MQPESFNYIIVGAGSAGCVLAARLSEDPSVRVALLEAGGADKSVLIHCPLGMAAANDNHVEIVWVKHGGSSGARRRRRGAKRHEEEAPILPFAVNTGSAPDNTGQTLR